MQVNLAESGEVENVNNLEDKTVFKAKVYQMHTNTALKAVLKRKGKVKESVKDEDNATEDMIVKKAEPFRSVDDMKNLINYFSNNGKWIHYLGVIIGINTGRRVSDILKLKWRDFYNMDVTVKEALKIVEKKTKKVSQTAINDSVKNAILTYLKKTKTYPYENMYKNNVFLQSSGTHKGKMLSYSGFNKALKSAADAVGIKYHVSTHSLRKSFGYWSRVLHPNDPNSMQILVDIFKHSSEKITHEYIGLSEESKKQYMSDIGDFCTKYVLGDEKFSFNTSTPIISIESGNLRDILLYAYEQGKKNSSDTDSKVHIEAMNQAMELVETLMIK